MRTCEGARLWILFFIFDLCFNVEGLAADAAPTSTADTTAGNQTQEQQALGQSRLHRLCDSPCRLHSCQACHEAVSRLLKQGLPERPVPQPHRQLLELAMSGMQRFRPLCRGRTAVGSHTPALGSSVYERMAGARCLHSLRSILGCLFRLMAGARCASFLTNLLGPGTDCSLNDEVQGAPRPQAAGWPGTRRRPPG